MWHRVRTLGVIIPPSHTLVYVKTCQLGFQQFPPPWDVAAKFHLPMKGR